MPRSLANIFREYTEDLGHPNPPTGDLTPWTEQGVLLRVLHGRHGDERHHIRGMLRVVGVLETHASAEHRALESGFQLRSPLGAQAGDDIPSERRQLGQGHGRQHLAGPCDGQPHLERVPPPRPERIFRNQIRQLRRGERLEPRGVDLRSVVPPDAAGQEQPIFHTDALLH